MKSPVESDASRPALTAARDSAVLCDLANLHVLWVSGADAAAFLQGQLSIDVGALAPETARYACFNSPKGRMLANFVLWRASPAADGFRLLLPADVAPAVAKRLAMYKLRSKVSIADASDESVRFGVGGPAAERALRTALGGAPATFATTVTPDTTVLGLPGGRFLIVAVPAFADEVRARFAALATVAPFDVWRYLTIRAGVPVVTAATQEMFVAQAANWDVLGGIDFNKGCYTGQEIIARTQYLGRLKDRTFLFHVDRRDVSAGDRVYSAAFGDQPCGTIVNAAAAPGGGCDLLAIVQIAAVESGDVRFGAPDGESLVALPLPYSIPPAAAPRGRMA